jgi:hypothetical protein
MSLYTWLMILLYFGCPVSVVFRHAVFELILEVSLQTLYRIVLCEKMLVLLHQLVLKTPQRQQILPMTRAG